TRRLRKHPSCDELAVAIELNFQKRTFFWNSQRMSLSATPSTVVARKCQLPRMMSANAKLSHPRSFFSNTGRREPSHLYCSSCNHKSLSCPIGREMRRLGQDLVGLRVEIKHWGRHGVQFPLPVIHQFP